MTIINDDSLRRKRYYNYCHRIRTTIIKLSRLAYLHLTLAHSEGQGHAQFDCKYVVNDDLINTLLLPWIWFQTLKGVFALVDLWTRFDFLVISIRYPKEQEDIDRCNLGSVTWRFSQRTGNNCPPSVRRYRHEIGCRRFLRRCARRVHRVKHIAASNHVGWRRVDSAASTASPGFTRRTAAGYRSTKSEDRHRVP